MAIDGRYLATQIAHAKASIAAFTDFALEDLLPHLSTARLEERAEQVSQAEYSRMGCQPGEGDLAGAAEAAEEKGQRFFDTIFTLAQTIRNLLVVGLFHSFEQELADTCRDDSLPPAPESRLEEVAKWYAKFFGLDLSSLPCWQIIKELQLCANTAKHADGKSARKLKELRPDLFEHPVARESYPDLPPLDLPVEMPLGGRDLFVTEEDLRRYASAAGEMLNRIAAHFERHADECFPHQE